MKISDCFDLFEKAKVLSCATIAADGAPRLRCITEFRIENEQLFFLTMRGRSFCHQLLADSRIMLMAAFPGDLMVRLGGRALPVPTEEQLRWKVAMIRGNEHLAKLYPLKNCDASIIFQVTDGFFEVVDRSHLPIQREYIRLGNGEIKRHGFLISDRCAGCGSCLAACPQRCILPGKPFTINESHCLHCGACYEACPQGAIDRMNAIGIVDHGSEKWPEPSPSIFSWTGDEDLLP